MLDVDHQRCELEYWRDAGWSQKGIESTLNAVLTGGVQVTSSHTISCPETGIANLSNFVTGQPQWRSIRWDPPGETRYTSYNQWIWEVPFSAYNPGAEVLVFTTQGESSFAPLFPVYQQVLLIHR